MEIILFVAFIAVILVKLYYHARRKEQENKIFDEELKDDEDNPAYGY